jgi:hypothetical protein
VTNFPVRPIDPSAAGCCSPGRNAFVEPDGPVNRSLTLTLQLRQRTNPIPRRRKEASQACRLSLIPELFASNLFKYRCLANFPSATRNPR